MGHTAIENSETCGAQSLSGEQEHFHVHGLNGRCD